MGPKESGRCTVNSARRTVEQLDIAAEETLCSLLLRGYYEMWQQKQDLREAEERLQKQIEELRKDIWKLDERVDRLNQRIDSLVKWMVGLLASIWLTLVALLLPIILKTLGIIG